MRLTQHFTSEEMVCPCCGVMGMDQEVLNIIEVVRQEYGKPMIINSAYRCEKHNEAIQASPTSSHVLGLALDIRCESSGERHGLLRHLLKHCTRLGIGDGFIHADWDHLNKSSNVVWTYYD